MEHFDPKNLLTAFEQVANDHLTTVTAFLDNPSLLDLATQRFLPKLNRLRTSWTQDPKWKYATAVKNAYNLIRSDYGNEKDRSGALMFYHPLAVADNSFRLCKLFGFNDKEATTIWTAALCHDYLEGAKTEEDFQRRLKKMKRTFNSHDPDVTNLVIMLTNRNKTRPYFKYVEQIGHIDGFTAESTSKAQLGACIIKDSDTGHNTDLSRNHYLDQLQITAESMARSDKLADRQQGKESLAKVERTRTKVQMYPIARALMRAKIKGILNVPGGVHIETSMVDFLLSDDGAMFQIDTYAAALTVGLGPAENDRYTRLLTQKQEKENNVVAFPSSRKPNAGQKPALKRSFSPASSKGSPAGKDKSTGRCSLIEEVKNALLPRPAQAV